MRILKNFKCKPCKLTTEELVNTDDIVNCAKCGKECVKMLSSAKYLSNTVGRSPALK